MTTYFERGLITPHTLLIFEYYNSESCMSFLKRMLVLFDKMVIIPDFDTSLMSYNADPLFQIKRCFKDKEFEEIKKIKTALENFVVCSPSNNSVHYIHKNAHEAAHCFPYDISADTKFMSFFDSYFENHIKNYDTIYWKSYDEFKTHFVKNLGYDLRLLYEASEFYKRYTDCKITPLMTGFHENVIQNQLVRMETNIPNTLINCVEDINCFDFGQLTWDNIIELRSSEFVNDFRNKMKEWLFAFSTPPSKESIESKIQKYIVDAKFKFIQNKIPKPKTTIFKAILCNLPLPIPVNPASIADALKNIKADFNTKKDYSWLFFIQEAYKKYNNANSADAKNRAAD